VGGFGDGAVDLFPDERVVSASTKADEGFDTIKCEFVISCGRGKMGTRLGCRIVVRRSLRRSLDGQGWSDIAPSPVANAKVVLVEQFRGRGDCRQIR